MTANLPPLITKMLSPDFYPHQVTQTIELLQTHISFVFLTGKYAYKVKKPMNFGFLDFSSLDKRLHFCQEEIRLNRRLCPDLYLDVRAITGEKEKFGFAKDIQDLRDQIVVEYAIQMLQFPQENLLINLFEQDKLTVEHVTEIGKQLAKFHQQADTNEHISSFGTIAAVQAVAEDNYEHTVKYIGLAQTQTQFDQIRAYTQKFFTENAHLFSDRIAAHKVKECHGDVHLKNICVYNGNIQIFDCIEFNEPFRNSDVIYDAAFLLMDLQYRDRHDLANAFLNTYLEQTGDYTAVVLLPLYCSMRAYVRAKVTSFLLDDPNIPQTVKDNAREEASAYYKLAWQYTQQPQQGQIIIMSGLSGAGKSTVARNLAQKISAIHIRSDAVRKHLAGIDLMERGSEEIYTSEMTAKTYGNLLEWGLLIANQGFNVILDAKYDRVALRAAVIEQAQAHNLPLHILYCTADSTVLQQRLGDRTVLNNDIADATADLIASQRAQFEALSEVEQLQAITIDTSQELNFDLLLEKVTSHI